MSDTASGMRSADGRIRAQNYNFNEEKLIARRNFHLSKIERTLKNIPASRAKPTKFERLKKFFGTT